MMNTEKQETTNENEDNQSEDDWYDQMEKFAMNRPAEDLDEMDKPAQATAIFRLAETDEENEDSYFESMQNDANSRTDTFVGEGDRMWQDLVRTMRNEQPARAHNTTMPNAKSQNGSNHKLKKVAFSDESAKILILQWLFSYLPRSLTIIKQLEGYVQQQNNGLFVVDHVEHPSIAVTSFFNETTKAIHVSLFSSLSVSNQQLLLHHIRQLQSIHSMATSLRLVAVGQDIYETTFSEAVGFHEEWVEYCEMYCCLETTVSHCQFLQSIVDSLSDSFELSTLRLEDSEIINSTWKYKSDESIHMVQGMIEECKCQGIRSKSTGELVAWCLTYKEGPLGMLYTLESHRRIGLARIVVAGLLLQTLKDSSEIASYPPYCFIEESNDVSKSLFRSLGFAKVYEVVWAGLRFNSLK